jgi:hypothetical protein
MVKNTTYIPKAAGHNKRGRLKNIARVLGAAGMIRMKRASPAYDAAREKVFKIRLLPSFLISGRAALDKTFSKGLFYCIIYKCRSKDQVFKGTAESLSGLNK